MGYKILAVDDEPSISKLVSHTLSRRGHEVVTANDGTTALSMAVLEKPDLIVLDVMMPKMDGWEVRRRLKENPVTKGIPIVFLTAVGQFEKQLAAMESGSEDYVTKPFEPAELVDVVEGFLDPAKRGDATRHADAKKAKLRTIVEIMHRDRDKE